MTSVKVSLNSIDKVKEFVNDISGFNAEFDLVAGRNGKGSNCSCENQNKLFHNTIYLILTFSSNPKNMGIPSSRKAPEVS